jgi:opine dehydrogenase
MPGKPRFAVLGAGVGGHAMVVDLSLAGCEVGLYELPDFADRIQAIKERGGIEASGAVSGFARVNRASTDAADIVPDADVIMVAVPAFGHQAFVDRIVPHLHAGQILLFNTGYYAALRFRGVLKQAGKDGVILAENMILPYTGTMTGPARVYVAGKKTKMSVAALPASKTAHVLERTAAGFPEFVPAANVIETTLNNLNLMSHVPVTLLNKGRVEQTSPVVLSVRESTTPSVAKLMEAVDRERVRLGGALGANMLTILDMLKMWGYYTSGENVYDAYHASRQFATFSYEYVNGGHQYLREDLSFGLVPTVSLAELVKVPMPIMRALVDIFSVVDGIDYWQTGITAAKLGLSGMSAREIMDLVTYGES